MPEHYTHLTYVQRCQIFVLKQRNFTQAEIAVDIGVSQSCISRELRRNAGKGGYSYSQAHEFSAKRGLASRQVARVMTAPVIQKIEFHLTSKQWSPDQIAKRLFMDDKIEVSHESIYRHIWADKRKGGQLYLHLRQRGKKRNKRSGKNAGRGLIPGRIDIAERPAIVNEKSRIGDWELDSIIGAKHRGAITSMVERKSLLTRLALLTSPTKEATEKAIIKQLKPLINNVITLTSDNGKEFAGHAKISSALKADFYFATPYHAWERGVNENTNGLIRQYFPKGMDFATITQADVKRVEDLLNNRPRKTLGYLTPNEVFTNTKNQITNYALQM